jgi:hypothetical protein
MSETERDQCDVPGCDQPAVVLVANDAPCLAPQYLERWACRWHRSNPFGDLAPAPAGDSGGERG